MSRQSCWAVLGIARTDDARAIKRAYSARLKTIDPDADPQAFIALRDALEEAQARIARASLQQAQPEQDAAEPAPEPAQPGSVELNAQAIMAQLYGEGPIDEPELLRHWHALSADPRMDEVGLFDQVQQWAARVIAETAPRSAALVIPATEHFGWTADEGTVAQSPVLASIVHRYHYLRFLEAAREEGHTHHAAWVELTTPAPPGSRRGTVGPRLLFDLLEVIRGVHPDTEAQLDADRVALWDRLDRLELDDGNHEPSSGYSTPTWIGGGLFVIYVFMITVRACTSQPEYRPLPSPAPTSWEAREPITIPPPGDLMEARPSPTPTPTPFNPAPLR